MGTLARITRRSFLVGSTAIAGGVAFGTYMVKAPHANPLAEGLGPDAASFNPWVKIDGDGITLVTPHADLGQGAVSVQAALIAEEMDLEFGQFEIDLGQPSPAYYNTAFAEEGAPFRSSDRSLTAETVRDLMGGVVKLIGVQGTGGSTTVPDSYDKLRMAGACARESLKAAAARQTGIAADRLTTRAGAVHLPDGTAIAYTELASVAAGMPPVTGVSLRDPSQWRLLGKPMERIDILAKSTGTQAYGIDINVEGQVHAAVRVNPRKGGALRGYDAAVAETMPGVQKVVEISNGVAVIASNTWYAINAVNAIDCDWGPAPYPAEQADHWSALENSFTDDLLDSEWRHDGDVPAALAKGGAILEAEYRAPYVAHQPLEPMNAIVRINDDGTAEVWTGHQMQRFLQQVVAGVAGIEAGQVIHHNSYSGGSFGHRLEFEHIRQATEIALRMKGTPVKLTLSREEDFAQDFPRQIGMARGRGRVSEGRIDTLDLSICSPSVMRSQFGRIGQAAFGPDSQIAAGAWNAEYAIPNFRMRAYNADELAPISSWRSVGASTNGFFAESFLDELIHAAGRDPLEERIALASVDHHRRTLEAVGEMSSWGGALPAGRGRGVALVESFGVPVAEVVEVTATPGGIRIDKVWVAADVGRVLDPVNFENLVQGGVVWGLGHAINSEITYADGMAQQTNYHDAEGMRLYQCPEIIVRGLENNPKIRGIGEPPVPPAAPALANAIFAATGQRLREMPFNKHIAFV